jgi:predicted RNA-binding Zn-ribbon protein involved in translation (DUF1610 family)
VHTFHNTNKPDHKFIGGVIVYCLNCGYNLKNGESFCPKCGKVVSKQNYANNQNNGYNNYNQMYNSMNYANQNAGYAVPPVKKASNKGKIIAITVVSIVVVLAIIIGIISIAFSNSNKNLESYTVMIYMVGSDLESESQAATNDIYEMIESNVDVSRVNVILYAGGAKTWWIPISNDSKNILKMANTENGLDFISDNTSSDVEDMGEASTFSDFLNYAYTNYPADHYGLICRIWKR